MAFGLLNDSNTKLAIYYRYTKSGKQDTTVDYFRFSDYNAQHNYIERNLTGTPFLAAQGGTAPDNLIYLQNSPGSYATLKIPALRNLSNRIIHRAELIVEEVYDPSDAFFYAPQGIFIDLYDSTISKYKIVPYDYVTDNTGEGQIRFGMFGNNAVDAFGKSIRVWKFNVSRYVQNILIKKEPLHDFRLLTHRAINERYKINNGNNTGDYIDISVPINGSHAVGRVRVGGGNHATQKLRLRLVYSKI
jgi:hypothetical protein